MKKYFILSGKEQKGPFTIEELKKLGVTNDTLCWFEGTENWKKINEVPELKELLIESLSPPPPPAEYLNENQTRSKGGIKKLSYWIAFHLFALIFSYTGLKIFNDGRSGSRYETNEFWPFIDFTYKVNSSWFVNEIGKIKFNGLFFQYDWSEFIIYAGGGAVLFFLAKISQRN